MMCISLQAEVKRWQTKVTAEKMQNTRILDKKRMLFEERENLEKHVQYTRDRLEKVTKAYDLRS